MVFKMFLFSLGLHNPSLQGDKLIMLCSNLDYVCLASFAVAVSALYRPKNWLLTFSSHSTMFICTWLLCVNSVNFVCCSCFPAGVHGYTWWTIAYYQYLVSLAFMHLKQSLLSVIRSYVVFISSQVKLLSFIPIIYQGFLIMQDRCKSYL